MKLIYGLLLSTSVMFAGDNSSLIKEYIDFMNKTPEPGREIKQEGQNVLYIQTDDGQLQNFFGKPIKEKGKEILKMSSDIEFCDTMEAKILLREGIIFKVKLLDKEGNTYLNTETRKEDCKDIRKKEEQVSNYLLRNR